MHQTNPPRTPTEDKPFPPPPQSSSPFAFPAVFRYLIPMHHDEVIPILDFGSQYAQLIARRVREKGVYSEFVRPDIPADQLKKLNPKGLILSGGPSSVYEPNAPRCDPAIFDLGVPILGICYGMQIGAQILGGQVKPAKAREYGRAKLQVIVNDPLVHGLPADTTVWMSHGDQVHATSGHDFDRRWLPPPTAPYAGDQAPHAAEFFARPVPPRGHPHPAMVQPDHPATSSTTSAAARGTSGTMGSFIEQTVRRRFGPQVGDGPRDLRPVRRGRFRGRRRTTAPGHRASNSCAYSWTTACSARTSRELVESTFRGHFRLDLRVVQRRRTVSLTKLAGRDRSAAEAARLSAMSLSRRSRREAKTIDNAEVPGPGHAVSRRDRVRARAYGGKADVIKGHHNVWRPAGRTRLRAGRAVARPV